MNIVIGTTNAGKIKEIKEIFKNYDIYTLKEIEKIKNKELQLYEKCDTFEENALQKVRQIYDFVGDNYLCIADDSGLSIDALEGFPGVKTARWMEASDHIKNKELLNMMRNKLNRNCHYTTVIALKNKKEEKIFKFTLDGIITKESRGENGFGFDEIFETEKGLTLAEITQEEKMEISPRRKALDLVKEYYEKETN